MPSPLILLSSRLLFLPAGMCEATESQHHISLFPPSLIPSSRLSPLPPRCRRCRRLHKAPACGHWAADSNVHSLQRSRHRRCAATPHTVCRNHVWEEIKSFRTLQTQMEGFPFSLFNYSFLDLTIIAFYQGVTQK